MALLRSAVRSRYTPTLSRCMDFFETLSPLPEDPIFGLQAAFLADQNPQKVNLGIGAYRDAEGAPLVFTAVRKAEENLLKQTLNKEYLPIAGSKDFIDETAKLIFGVESNRLKNGSLFGVQTVGGTNALRIGGELLQERTIFIPDLTWANHKLIFSRARLKVETYPYYNEAAHTFNFVGMSQAIKKMSPGHIIVLHGTSHNPTGTNPTSEQWKTLAQLIEDQQVIPFIDMAYQGFGKGIEEDAQVVRLFAEKQSILVSYTYAKNMGLYGERVGAFFVAAKNPDEAQKAGTHIKQIIRSMYSNPPLHGARIATLILQSTELRKEWSDELKSMRERIAEMRTAFVDTLLSKSNDTHFAFMNQGQTGLFAYTGIPSDRVQRLRREFGVYCPDGRINLAGLNWNNLDYVTNAILAL